MKKVIGYFGLTLVAAVMLAAVLTYLAPHFKWRVDAVASGSMEPQIKTGSLVVTRPVEPDEIAVGDIITFKSASGGTMITHRQAITIFRRPGIQTLLKCGRWVHPRM